MGLKEQIQSGAKFVRSVETLSIGSGSSTAFGSTYILLDITSNGAGRTRLYSDSASLKIDEFRPTASFNYSASVGLSLDTLYSDATKITFDPPIIVTTFSASQTWYNVSGSPVTLTYYPIESTYNNRQTLEIASALTIPTGLSDLGNSTSPKSFIILSASCTTDSTRLRLYSRNINTISSAEKSRVFSSNPSDGSSLIVDMIFDSSSYGYKLSPVLEGYNLATYQVGQNQVGWILENLSGSSISNVTASLYIYVTED